jgi:hypothetical protein
MQPLDLIIGAFLAFLLIGGVSLILLVRRGRALCGELARRLPAHYEELGQPYPGFFLGPRRTAYMRFVMRSEFIRLSDPYLVEQFAKLRRSEVRQLILLLVGFGGLGAAAVWFEFVRAA